jgi:hypothetical protein
MRIEITNASQHFRSLDKAFDTVKTPEKPMMYCANVDVALSVTDRYTSLISSSGSASSSWARGLRVVGIICGIFSKRISIVALAPPVSVSLRQAVEVEIPQTQMPRPKGARAKQYSQPTISTRGTDPREQESALNKRHPELPSTPSSPTSLHPLCKARRPASPKVAFGPPLSPRFNCLLLSCCAPLSAKISCVNEHSEQVPSLPALRRCSPHCCATLRPRALTHWCTCDAADALIGGKLVTGSASFDMRWSGGW